MYEVTKRLKEISIAHRLPRHEGQCRFLHGHNYTPVITVQATLLDSQGMVVDFHLFSKFQEEMLDFYDHAVVLWTNDPLGGLLEDAQFDDSMGLRRLRRVEFTPTVEHLATKWLQEAHYFFNREVAGFRERGVCVKRMEVFETVDSCAVATAYVSTSRSN